MQKNPKARYLPIVIFPAIMPTLLMPLLLSHQIPANIVAAAMGFSGGLAIVGLFWIVKRGGRCTTDT